MTAKQTKKRDESEHSVRRSRTYALDFSVLLLVSLGLPMSDATWEKTCGAPDGSKDAPESLMNEKGRGNQSGKKGGMDKTNSPL